MANIKDCPGFETFGADIKEARKVKQLSRKTLAEQINIDWRYLANLENDDTIPSLPVIIQLNLERNVYWYNGKVMVAVYDNVNNMRSGTQQTVNYAKKKGLQIIYIHPDTAQVTTEDATLWK